MPDGTSVVFWAISHYHEFISRHRRFSKRRERRYFGSAVVGGNVRRLIRQSASGKYQYPPVIVVIRRLCQIGTHLGRGQLPAIAAPLTMVLNDSP